MWCYCFTTCMGYLLFTTLNPLNPTCLLFQPPLGHPLTAPVSSTYTQGSYHPNQHLSVAAEWDALGTHLVPLKSLIWKMRELTHLTGKPTEVGGQSFPFLPLMSTLKMHFRWLLRGPHDLGTSEHGCRQLTQ